MVVELGLGMEINCHWTFHDRYENPPSCESTALTGDSVLLGSLYLLEEVAFHIMRPFESFARNNR
ncbi:hypothetical protein BDV40DRAFT_277965 [Aspergillus tamarii]|uniref:Uncharacterized protein n=1 Tax=Aspergillus tamarii TaxID=41984 RepID=A0A5N6UHA7_ASPTM|nr:hypothetical protein BDV40DRAFT_277965 [Aspergillus tamarii]